MREELGGLAARVRERALGEATAEEVEAYERASAVASGFVAGVGGGDDLTARMREQFMAEATRTYVGELGMSASVIEPLLETYADAL